MPAGVSTEGGRHRAPGSLPTSHPPSLPPSLSSLLPVAPLPVVPLPVAPLPVGLLHRGLVKLLLIWLRRAAPQARSNQTGRLVWHALVAASCLCARGGWWCV